VNGASPRQGFVLRPSIAAPRRVQFTEAYRSYHLVAETPCGNWHLGNLVGVVLADPVLDVSADFGR
jgi:hypothetical protein